MFITKRTPLIKPVFQPLTRLRLPLPRLPRLPPPAPAQNQDPRLQRLPSVRHHDKRARPAAPPRPAPLPPPPRRHRLLFALHALRLRPPVRPPLPVAFAWARAVPVPEPAAESAGVRVGREQAGEVYGLAAWRPCVGGPRRRGRDGR